MDSKDKNNVSDKKMRVRDYFYWALSILLIGLLLVCVILFAIGFRPAVVLTPSMKPTINPGSLVLVKSIAPEKIKVGDVVMFWPSADGGTDADEISVTHRVIEIKTDEETGKLIFITHGDANGEGSNERVPQSQIIGKVHLAIPVVGILFLFIKNNLFVVIFSIIAIICLWYLIAMIIKNNKGKKAAATPNGNVVETNSKVVNDNSTKDLQVGVQDNKGGKLKICLSKTAFEKLTPEEEQSLQAMLQENSNVSNVDVNANNEAQNAKNDNIPTKNDNNTTKK